MGWNINWCRIPHRNRLKLVQQKRFRLATERPDRRVNRLAFPDLTSNDGLKWADYGNPFATPQKKIVKCIAKMRYLRFHLLGDYDYLMNCILYTIVIIINHHVFWGNHLRSTPNPNGFLRTADENTSNLACLAAASRESLGFLGKLMKEGGIESTANVHEWGSKYVYCMYYIYIHIVQYIST
jgi:hypothetical protein